MKNFKNFAMNMGMNVVVANRLMEAVNDNGGGNGGNPAPNPKPEAKPNTINIGGRDYPARDVFPFEGTIIGVTYLEHYADKRQKTLQEIADSGDSEAAERYDKAAPKFKLAVRVLGREVLMYNEREGRVTKGKTIFITDRDLNIAIGNNDILRDGYHEQIFDKANFDALIGTTIRGTQIVAHAQVPIYHPYTSVQAEAWTPNHDDTLNVCNSISMNPYGEINGFAQTQFVLKYVEKLMREGLKPRGIKMMFKRTSWINFYDEECRDTFFEDIDDLWQVNK